VHVHVRGSPSDARPRTVFPATCSSNQLAHAPAQPRTKLTLELQRVFADAPKDEQHSDRLLRAIAGAASRAESRADRRRVARVRDGRA